MAVNHINLNTALVKGAQMWALVAQAQTLRSGMGNMLAVLAEMRDGSDYHAIGVAMGISDAEAALLYGLVQSADAVLQGADMDYLVNRLG